MAQKSVVLLHLKAIGEAPALKNAKFKIDGGKTVADVEKFLQKQLKYEGALFLFCGSGFSPTPDQKLQTLFDSFQSGSELVIQFGYQEAWG